MTTTTYRAVQVSNPGRLEVVERELTAPLPGKVRIRIEACGVCHTDRRTVEGLTPGASYPRVPGHEVVGRIDALGEACLPGSSASGWGSAFSVAIAVAACPADGVTL
jgi:D-arabinose 1-dehydrogenase-like Zn-dependent alcohol dehydrogenase